MLFVQSPIPGGQQDRLHSMYASADNTTIHNGVPSYSQKPSVHALHFFPRPSLHPKDPIARLAPVPGVPVAFRG